METDLISAILMTPVNSSLDSGTGRLFAIEMTTCACNGVNRETYTVSIASMERADNAFRIGRYLQYRSPVLVSLSQLFGLIKAQLTIASMSGTDAESSLPITLTICPR